jgi:hypothetical protein
MMIPGVTRETDYCEHCLSSDVGAHPTRDPLEQKAVHVLCHDCHHGRYVYIPEAEWDAMLAARQAHAADTEAREAEARGRLTHRDCWTRAIAGCGVPDPEGT